MPYKIDRILSLQEEIFCCTTTEVEVYTNPT